MWILKESEVLYMDKFYRIIDANINRASEGVRVLEDFGEVLFRG